MKDQPDHVVLGLAIPSAGAIRRRTVFPRAAAEQPRNAQPFIAIAWVIALGVLMPAQSALAQSNLDAGKSPAQIFADTCSACHKSPREIKRTSAAFMREHYTTGTREATAMAAYLAGVGSDAQAVSQRKPPALGSGQSRSNESARSAAPAQQGDQIKPEAQAALPGPGSPTGAETKPVIAPPRPRRPSESVEVGLPAATDPILGPQDPTGGARRAKAAEEFEE